MKKLIKLLPILGFLIAVVLVCITSAFKTAPKTADDETLLTFQYMPGTPADYSQNRVQDVSHWQYTGDDDDCGNYQKKACKIYVSEAHVNGTTPATYSLDQSVNIQAAVNPNNSSEYFVSQTADGTSTDYISNRNE